VVIDIDEEQRSILQGLVDTRLRNLSSEIRHTDSTPMRRDLRDERESLRLLITMLEPASQVAQG
jgi:hypothetical protein